MVDLLFDYVERGGGFNHVLCRFRTTSRSVRGFRILCPLGWRHRICHPIAIRDPEPLARRRL